MAHFRQLYDARSCSYAYLLADADWRSDLARYIREFQYQEELLRDERGIP